MTDNPEQTRVPDSAEAAMNEVLAAEQTAARAIGACAREARASLREAALRARHIAGRTNERIALIHQRTRQQLKNHLRNAGDAARAAEQTRDREDPRMAVISRVVNVLAVRLTGANGSDNTRAD
jgi:DNA-binding CsgD family transcriptional regulator